MWGNPRVRGLLDSIKMFTRSYPIVPVPKPRMTSGRGTQHTAAAERYWAFKDECSLRGVTLESGEGIVFVLPMTQTSRT